MKLIIEIWNMLRVYLVHIIVDAILSSLLWVLLWLFKKLTILLPIDGFVGGTITNIHSIGAILAFSLFSFLFITDVLKIHSNE